MRRLIPALVAAVAGFSTAHAAAAKTPPLTNKSFGDGGGYKHPDAEVGRFFETKPPGHFELKPERPRLAAKVATDIRPVTTTPSRPRPRPFASVVAKAAAATPAAGADMEGGALDSAGEDARRDYEARLFGAASAPKRPGLGALHVMPWTDTALPASMDEGLLFVSLELDPQEAGALRDAVSGLGVAADFRPDARFQPLPGLGGSVRISGWLPVSRLGDVVARPGVRRVAVERGSRPMGDDRLTGEYLLKLRATDAAHPAVAASVRELSAATGFKLDRVVSVETVPGGGAAALVSGTMPVSRLSRALALPGVLKISSALPASAAAWEESEAAAGSVSFKKKGFLKFVMAKNLWLVLLTALLALSVFGTAFKKGLAVFVPYR